LGGVGLVYLAELPLTPATWPALLGRCGRALGAAWPGAAAAAREEDGFFKLCVLSPARPLVALTLPIAPLRSCRWK
jgi:hypothetical protein